MFIRQFVYTTTVLRYDTIFLGGLLYKGTVAVHHVVRWKARELWKIVVDIPASVLIVDVHGWLEVIRKYVDLSVDVALKGTRIKCLEGCLLGSMVDRGTAVDTLHELQSTSTVVDLDLVFSFGDLIVFASGRKIKVDSTGRTQSGGTSVAVAKSVHHRSARNLEGYGSAVALSFLDNGLVVGHDGRVISFYEIVILGIEIMKLFCTRVKI